MFQYPQLDRFRGKSMHRFLAYPGSRRFSILNWIGLGERTRARREDIATALFQYPQLDRFRGKEWKAKVYSFDLYVSVSSIGSV